MKRLMVLASLLLALIVATAALAASGGLGKFQTKLTGKGANTEHGKLDGTWTIDLSTPRSGKVHLTWNGENGGGGKYVISGSKITLTPKKNGSCKTKGKYKFTLVGNQLTFTKITDSCTERRDVLTGHAWTKVR
jgi:hypothetical protein